MRLSVFIADTLSNQLLIDLQKIYAGHLAPAALTEQAIKEQLAQADTKLYVTMFNERHIGAVNVKIQDTTAIFSQLAIRDLTRRRGVGKNLLKQIEKEIAAEGIKKIEYNLKEVLEDQYLATQAFFSDSGYTINNHIASKSLC